MIRRSPRPTSHFTTICNDVLRDERLSYRARGVLVSLLSRPDNWSISREALMKEGKEGRDAITKAMDELSEAGYLVRNRYQNDDGKWRTEVVVFDHPVTGEQTEEPTTENPSSVTENPQPTTGKPTTGKPTVGEPVVKRRNDKKKREEITTNACLNSEALEEMSEARRLCEHLAQRIVENGSKTPTISKAWLTDMDRLMRIDGRTPEQIERAIDWCQSDSFWRSNILSPKKLRDKYDQLRLNAKRAKDEERNRPTSGIAMADLFREHLRRNTAGDYDQPQPHQLNQGNEQ